MRFTNEFLCFGPLPGFEHHFAALLLLPLSDLIFALSAAVDDYPLEQ
jgi:hypothetical protein